MAGSWTGPDGSDQAAAPDRAAAEAHRRLRRGARSQSFADHATATESTWLRDAGHARPESNTAAARVSRARGERRRPDTAPARDAGRVLGVGGRGGRGSHVGGWAHLTFANP